MGCCWHQGEAVFFLSSISLLAPCSVKDASHMLISSSLEAGKNWKLYHLPSKPTEAQRKIIGHALRIQNSKNWEANKTTIIRFVRGVFVDLLASFSQLVYRVMESSTNIWTTTPHIILNHDPESWESFFYLFRRLKNIRKILQKCDKGGYHFGKMVGEGKT